VNNSPQWEAIIPAILRKACSVRGPVHLPRVLSELGRSSSSFRKRNLRLGAVEWPIGTSRRQLGGTPSLVRWRPRTPRRSRRLAGRCRRVHHLVLPVQIISVRHQVPSIITHSLPDDCPTKRSVLFERLGVVDSRTQPSVPSLLDRLLSPDALQRISRPYKQAEKNTIIAHSSSTEVYPQLHFPLVPVLCSFPSCFVGAILRACWSCDVLRRSDRSESLRIGSTEEDRTANLSSGTTNLGTLKRQHYRRKIPWLS